jgi:hypothetical protein
MDVERSPLKSKKFIAAMIFDLGWTLGMIYALYLLGDALQGSDVGKAAGLTSLVLAMCIVKGAAQVLYVGGQAALDKYVRVAKIAAGQGDEPDSDLSQG